MRRLALRLLYWILAALARRGAYDLVYSKQLPKLRPRCWEMVLTDKHTAGRPCILKPLHHGDHHAEPLGEEGRLFEETVEDLRTAYVALLDTERYDEAVAFLADVEAAVHRCPGCGGVGWWVWSETTKSYFCGVCH
jgi:hypothetical protein